MTNHWLDELASKHMDMPSPGVESRLLQEIATRQKRINALEASITFMIVCCSRPTGGSLENAIREGNFALGIKEETEEDTK